jgi:SET domain-containing protein
MMSLVIKRDKIKGRGVYTTEDISKDSVIEICELLILDLNHVPDELEPYVYEYTNKTAAVALGNGSLYNHSDRPNCYFDIDYRNKKLVIKSLKKIKAGEELTIHYHYDKASRRKFNIRS